MVRIAILLVLLCLSVLEWRAGTRKAVYWISLLGLFLFFSLRYGQGTDYLTYMSIYANVGPLQQLPRYNAFQYGKIEIGVFYLMSFFRMLSVHYVLFIAIVTLCSLLCIDRFIRKFCALPMFALTFFFAIYSLTYMESAIRQLLALSLALGVILVDWSDGKRIRPLVCIVIASLLHTSAVVLFILPLLFWQTHSMFLLQWKLRTSVIWLTLLAAASVVINFIDLTPLITLLPAQLSYTILSYYSQSSQISMLAFANRSLFMLITLALAHQSKDKLTNPEKLLFNLYCTGYGLYLLLISFDLIASRTNVYFRIVEIVLLPLLLLKNRDMVQRSIVALPIVLALLSFIYVKDIAAIMDFAHYYRHNPLYYPYITIFNSQDLLDNKFVNVKNAQAMNAYQTGGFSWNEYYDSLLRKPAVRSPIVPY